MYQHVAQRLSLPHIRTMFEEFFGLRRQDMRSSHVQIADGPSTTGPPTESLLKKILSGHLLHVDETEVKLQTGKGYVWVFTNLEEVVYMYRPTREGDFLKDCSRTSTASWYPTSTPPTTPSTARNRSASST